jgi:hypothetical protein
MKNNKSVVFSLFLTVYFFRSFPVFNISHNIRDVKAKGWSEIDNGVNIGTCCHQPCAVAVVKICIIISIVIFFLARW